MKTIRYFIFPIMLIVSRCNINIAFAGQAAEGFMDLAIDSANGTCSD